MQIDWIEFLRYLTTNNLVIALATALVAAIVVPWQYFKQKIINDIDDTFVKNGILEFINEV